MSNPNHSNQQAPFFVVSGASGSGKTTICRQLADEYHWYYSISYTTRPKRPHEMHGKDYYFVSKDEFQKMISRGEFLEWAEVYHNFYGTSRVIIEEKLKDGQGVILDVDTQGAANIKKMMPQAILVFINTPSIEVLETRLRSRSTDSDDEIKRRMQSAANEIAKIGQYDHIIVNDNLEQALADFRKIIEQRIQD